MNGKNDWRSADLRMMSFVGVNLEGIDFRGSDMRGSNFNSANLRYADLRGCDVRGCNFQHANLFAAKMQGVQAHEADFRGADMRLARLEGADLHGAALPRSDAARPPHEIAANGKDHRPERQNGQERGGQHERPGRSPSAIAADARNGGHAQAGPDRSQEHDRGIEP